MRGWIMGIFNHVCQVLTNLWLSNGSVHVDVLFSVFVKHLFQTSNDSVLIVVINWKDFAFLRIVIKVLFLVLPPSLSMEIRTTIEEWVLLLKISDLLILRSWTMVHCK